MVTLVTFLTCDISKIREFNALVGEDLILFTVISRKGGVSTV